MKRFGSMVCALVIAALVIAAPVATFAGGKTTHDMAAEVVSIDVKAKTITLKDEKGENHTAPLMGAAIKEAESLKAGDKVKCTCQDGEKGEHQGVIAIKKG